MFGCIASHAHAQLIQKRPNPTSRCILPTADHHITIQSEQGVSTCDQWQGKEVSKGNCKLSLTY